MIPMTRPEIIMTGGVQRCYTQTLARSRQAQPARAGEVLVLLAKGLGPTRNNVPGQPFPSGAARDREFAGRGSGERDCGELRSIRSAFQAQRTHTESISVFLRRGRRLKASAAGGMDRQRRW